MTNESIPAYPNYRAALHAIDMLTRPCDNCPPIRDDHPHDHFSHALRDLLIDRDYTPLPSANDSIIADTPAYAYDTLRPLLATIDDYPYSRDDLTTMLLDNSLCPLHAIDYAICFDDDDPDCAAIRMIHPSHDT